MVHNAGITRDKTLGRMKDEQWDLCLNVNLAAVMRLNEALIEGPFAGGGNLIFLSSISGLSGNVGQANYSAAKAGLRRLGRGPGGRGWFAVTPLRPGLSRPG